MRFNICQKPEDWKQKQTTVLKQYKAKTNGNARDDTDDEMISCSSQETCNSRGSVSQKHQTHLSNGNHLYEHCSIHQLLQLRGFFY